MQNRRARLILNKFFKIVISVLCIYFIISYFTPNVMSQIGKHKVYGTNNVPEIERNDTWEWMGGLETMGAMDVEYKEKYLSEDILSISLLFFHNVFADNLPYNNNDVSIGIMVNLSESDKVRMGLGVNYDYEEKKLIYDPVYILQGEPGNSERYSDEKSIDEYLNKYGLTRQDVKEYQEYAIYDIIVKTWTKAHYELYWLERWKLKRCKVVDNTFQFEEENIGYIGDNNLEETQAVNFEYIYHTLNRNIFGNNMLIPWFKEETKQEVEAYAESVKGDLIEVWEEESMFPQGLVIELENMIYQSLNSSMDKIRWEEIEQSIYFETMRKLGMEKWHPDMEEMKILFPELADPNLEFASVYDAYRKVCGDEGCFDLFHFHMSPDSDNYLLAISSGGTAGVCYIWLTELVNSEFVRISEFETQNSGYGVVIQYEGEFYYIFLENNYDYVWKNLYNTSEGMKWDGYIESIREEITSDKYLENGTDESGWSVYFGDEKAVEDFIVPENEKKYYSNEYYQIDFTNMGVPIYMRKSGFVSSNSYSTWHLKTLFYLQNPLDDSIVTLQNMEINPYIPNDREPVLVQMWFKEMEGKVYTFCLYHVTDYNYMLNVVRLEGHEVNRIRTDILSPQRHFVLTEGRKFVY